MNLRSQIILLLLLLIALISWCVYTYDYDLSLNKNSATIETIDTKPEENMQNIEENINEDIHSSKNDIINSTLANIEANTTTNIIDNKQSLTDNENINTEENLDINNISDEIQINEISTNEIIEPLITINEKYIRENNEQRIENLSQETQKLQIKILDILKKNPIIFKSQSNVTTKSSNISINKIVDILNEYKNIKVEVAGHTDASGPEALNEQISLKRAVNIQNTLIRSGINENRIISRGYGESIPLVKNSRDGYSRKNRRVEFNIIQE